MLVVRLGGFYGDLYENSVDGGPPVPTPATARKHRTAGDAHSFIASRKAYWCGAQPQLFYLLDEAPACEHVSYADARIVGLREVDGVWRVFTPAKDKSGRFKYPAVPDPISAVNGVILNGSKTHSTRVRKR
jgi:hypothetical protein